MVTALVFAGLLSDCTSSASQPERTVGVAVRPGSSLADQAVQIEITGLSPGGLVNVQLRSTDAHGVPWQASAAYRADPGGDVDLSTAAAISGSYHGISGMGLIWSMHALKPDPAGAYFWGDTPLAFTLAVSAHSTQVASASFQRKFSAGATAETMESLPADGFVGEFWHPANTASRRPAVLVLAGSEGGLPGVLLPALLASSGYPALGVAYFAEPGLPQTRTSGYKARCSWTAARQTRHGPHAHTPKPYSACSTPITIAGHTCCTPTPAPDTRLGHSSPMSPLPPSQTLTTPPTSRHAHCYGPICSPFSPD